MRLRMKQRSRKGTVEKAAIIICRNKFIVRTRASMFSASREPNIFRRLQLGKPRHAMRSAFMGPWPALVHRRIRPQPWQPQSCSSCYITGSLCSRDLDPSRWLRLPRPVLRRGTSVPPHQHVALLFSSSPPPPPPPPTPPSRRTRTRRLGSNHPQTKQPPSTTATTFSPAPA